MTDQTYNGWADWTTWNCALWIQNDQWLYDIAKECVDYKEFLHEVLYMVGMENDATQDGADWGEANLDEGILYSLRTLLRCRITTDHY